MKELSVPVEEFTTPNPITATEDTTVEQMNELMNKYRIRHLPILVDGRVVGIVSDRDLRVVLGLDAKEREMLRAADIMKPDPVTVNSLESIRKVALEMSKFKIGSVLVNDDNDRFLGIFTVTDALNALIEILEPKRSLG
jgi:predicted transcriptional regulator